MRRFDLRDLNYNGPADVSFLIYNSGQLSIGVEHASQVIHQEEIPVFLRRLKNLLPDHWSEVTRETDNPATDESPNGEPPLDDEELKRVRAMLSGTVMTNIQPVETDSEKDAPEEIEPEPFVYDGPGEYWTRDGRLARVISESVFCMNGITGEIEGEFRNWDIKWGCCLGGLMENDNLVGTRIKSPETEEPAEAPTEEPQEEQLDEPEPFKWDGPGFYGRRDGRLALVYYNTSDTDFEYASVTPGVKRGIHNYYYSDGKFLEDVEHRLDLIGTRITDPDEAAEAVRKALEGAALEGGE